MRTRKFVETHEWKEFDVGEFIVATSPRSSLEIGVTYVVEQYIPPIVDYTSYVRVVPIGGGPSKTVSTEYILPKEK